MSLVRTLYDPRALALEMMRSFKEWARIDHDDDDNSITVLLARTIGLLERQFGVLIASQMWTWEPRDPLTEYTGVPVNRLCGIPGLPRVSWGFLPLPLRGITGFEMTLGPSNPGGLFRVVGDMSYAEFGQIYLQGLEGSIVQPGDVIKLSTVVTIDIVPFELVDVILRYALFMWENRESATERGMTEVPDWLNRAWGPFWSPRV